MQVLWNSVEKVVEYGLEGDFLEAGVYKGGSSMLMAYALMHLKQDKRIYLLDTFTGMTKPTERDVKALKGNTYFDKWEECQKDGYTDWCYGSLEEVKENMSRTGYENVVYVKGDVCKTVPHDKVKKLSLLRLDTDFYESTKHLMNHLFPLVEAGGFVIFDDYYCWKGAKDAVDEYFDSKGLNKKEIVEVDHSCAIYQKGGQR
jgi:predicted O-methyltransferase YrrM